MMMDFLFPDMEKRSTEKELMDFPDCDTGKLLNTVRQFGLLNILFTSSRRLIKRHVISEAVRRNMKDVSFLDLGAGGCDIAVWFLKKCKRLGIKASVTCLDSDRRIVEYSVKKYGAMEDITVIGGNAFDLERYGRFDFIFANHFLHHVDDEHIPRLLKLVKQQCNQVFLLNDIRRSNLSYLGYSLFAGVFTHGSFAFYDGRLSVRKGFLPEEMKRLVEEAGMTDELRIMECVPSRLYVTNHTCHV
jgi:2-polyprenyl-3-methyl-5-hydroxy-6-metoxy-1,4-benzoquinol methylase